MSETTSEGQGFWTASVRPIPSPRVLARLAASSPGGCYLASEGKVGSRSRYAFAAVDPFLVVRGAAWGSAEPDRAGTIDLEWRTPAPEDAPETLRRSGRRAGPDPIPLLAEILAAFPVPPAPSHPPFTGGLAGWFGYDMGRAFEKIPQRAPDPLGLPAFWIGAYDASIAIDRLTRKATLIATGYPERDPARRAARARARLEWLEAALAAAEAAEAAAPRRAPAAAALPARVDSNFTRDEYLDAVRRIKNEIRAGDIYQANLTQRLRWAAPPDPAAWFADLLDRNQVPFAAFVHGDGFDVVSISPERFLRVTDDLVSTDPIKGTRPRAAEPERDERNARDLLASPKDRAELVMIVDLLRNDLGRIAAVGSVEVPELFRLESYATVHHLVGRVTARLSPGAHALDALRAAFPGGSITGAPKIRAMQIIDEIEPHSRGLFMGAIGYVGANGEMDTSIAIRTVVVKDGVAHLQVGSGIVHDSLAEDEYDESLHKAASILGAFPAIIPSRKEPARAAPR